MKKGYKKFNLEKKLKKNYVSNYDFEGILTLTHDEDISKLAKVSKVISSNDLRYILSKGFDILANLNDNPQNLKFKSKLNKIHQADLVLNYLNDLNLNLNQKKLIKPIYLKKFKKDLKLGRDYLFNLALDEKIKLEELNLDPIYR